jgi:hypothetical protein
MTASAMEKKAKERNVQIQPSQNYGHLVLLQHAVFGTKPTPSNQTTDSFLYGMMHAETNRKSK